MTILKRIAAGVGISLVVGYILGKKKIDEALDVLSNIKVTVNTINDIDFGFSKTKVNLSLNLVNSTSIPFSINTGTLLNLHKVVFFTKDGRQLAEAYKTINHIDLPSNGLMTINDVDLEIDTLKLVNNANEILKPENLVIKAHIEVFGKPYII